MTGNKVEIYIESLNQLNGFISSEISKDELIDKLIVDYNLFDILPDDKVDELSGFNTFLALPYVLRRNVTDVLTKARDLLDKGQIKGLLIRNTEELGYFASLTDSSALICDAGIYAFNLKSANVLFRDVDEITLPLELNKGEKRSLIGEKPKGSKILSLIVYGRIPMMLSANCVYKTSGICEKRDYFEDYGVLTDRLGNEFPVIRHCDECMNIIYNCVPLSLHKDLSLYDGLNIRLCFTVENGEDMVSVIKSYLKLIKGLSSDITPNIKEIVKEYTTGHEKRGVE